MTSQIETNNIKVLLDIKPAFDGYAGIPQETRLLFRGLRSMKAYDVEGLIQHGSRKLKPGASPNRKALPESKRINRFSRMIVSVYGKSRSSTKEKSYSMLLGNIFQNIYDATVETIQSYFSLLLLRLRATFRIAITPSIFESNLFEDFIWRTFFSKTLRLEDKALITSARFRILSSSRWLLHKVGLAGRKFSSTPRYVGINTRGFDFFVAQTPFPARVSRGTRLIVRYHDAIPVLMPHTISDKAFHQASHFYALQENVRAGAWFCCVSEATRNDLLKIFPEAEPRASVIHNIVSEEYYEDESPKGLVSQIIRHRLATVKEFATNTGGLQFDDRIYSNGDFNYLMMVATLEPRKNHLLLMGAWEQLKYSSMPDLKLVIVGNPGWDFKPTLDAFRPWAERGDLFYLNDVPSAELRVLYKHAAATICPSLAEGFDYSGIEAMRSGGIVISSDIPVHREIFQSASEYFNPYSAEDAAMVIQRVLENEGLAIRQRLLQEARDVSSRYTASNILPKWEAYFRMLAES